MTGLLAAPRRKALLFEFLFVAVVVASFINTVVVYFVDGYLPQPYFYGGWSALTDWTATVFYAVNDGAYDVFATVYPPLSFIFLRIFSVHSCYHYYENILVSRECDWLAPITIVAFYFVNIPLVYLAYRVRDRKTAIMRTIALSLGLPLLFALERGNLIVPTFTCFVLGWGAVLKSARLRWLALALAINFKPYLVLTIFGHAVRRRWRWFEGVAITGLLVYLVSFALEGGGDPISLLTNISQFATSDARGIFERALYASSYVPILDLFKSNFPVMHFIGSKPIDTLSWVLPAMMNSARLGIVLCFAASAIFPTVIPVYRLAALGLSWSLIGNDPGGYAVSFLLFLVFMERWKGVARISALVIGYILSISWDYMIFKVSHEVLPIYLSKKVVGYDLGANLGELLRPGLVILMTDALVIASLIEVWRAFRQDRRTFWQRVHQTDAALPTAHGAL